jgi:ribonucleoside-diphosphate reductase alpha chain
VFRELAVSYLDRFDLAHVDPSQAGFDALGSGIEEGKPQAAKYVSKGLTRSRTDKLVVMPGGLPSPQGGEGGAATAAPGGEPAGGSRIAALASSGPRAEVSGTAALKAEEARKLSPAEQLEAQQLPFAAPKPDAKATAAARRAEAKAKGYEGEMCGECANFTLVRNGTCLKCDTCGATTGCS